MSTQTDIQLRCICGAGYCRVLVSGSSRNPDRTYIKCPKAIGPSKGCGLWQWLDEVRLCLCNAGICKYLKSNSSANPGKRVCCCPRSTVGKKGCGYFSWKDGNDKETIPEKVGEGKKECAKKKNVEEVRKFLEMKKAITTEVCDSILEQLEKLSLD